MFTGSQVSEEIFSKGKKNAEKLLGIFTNASKVEVVKMGEEPAGFFENVLQDGMFSREKNDSECYDDLFSGYVLTVDVDCDTDGSTVSKNSPNEEYSGDKYDLPSSLPAYLPAYISFSRYFPLPSTQFFFLSHTYYLLFHTLCLTILPYHAAAARFGSPSRSKIEASCSYFPSSDSCDGRLTRLSSMQNSHSSESDEDDDVDDIDDMFYDYSNSCDGTYLISRRMKE